ncbi:hypothetical protein CDL15_Pgr029156 [Punica granatum]|nr:hypothetical protein CDL15_Pgr029156 [Punica granatum]
MPDTKRRLLVVAGVASLCPSSPVSLSQAPALDGLQLASHSQLVGVLVRESKLKISRYIDAGDNAGRKQLMRRSS